MKRTVILVLMILCLLTTAPLSAAYAYADCCDEASSGSDAVSASSLLSAASAAKAASPGTDADPEQTVKAGAEPSQAAASASEFTQAATPGAAPARNVRSELIAEDGGYISTSSFASDHYMVGLFSEITEGFNTGAWDIADAQLTLSFSTTQLVSEFLSDITISINGVRFYSENVPVTDGTRRELTVKIPVEHITEGYNVIAIEGYMRTYNGQPCTDDVTSASWLNVFKESFVEISYRPVQPCRSISDFYSGFTSIEALENNQSAVAVATDYDTDEMDTALTVLAGVSRKAVKHYQNIHFIACDTCDGAESMKYVIYIAKPGHLPEKLATALSQNGGIEGSDAGLFMIPGGINVLIVTGNDGAALDKAAAVLSDPVLMNQLKGSKKIIDKDEDVFVRKEGVKQYTKLTEAGTYLDGPFRQKHDYLIDFENNRKLAYGSELDLYFRYSENLDFDRSLISVYVNNVPIGSQKLSQAKAEGDNIVLNIPTDTEVTGSFTLTVAFDLEVKDLWCTQRQSETPWAYVSSESMLKLNSVEVPYYLFENYPYPFISGGEFNDVVLMMPDKNSDLDLDLMGKFMLTLGQYIKYNTGEFSVARASEPGDLNDKNVIAVGTFTNNPFIAGLNDQLFFRFYSNGAGIMPNEKLLIEPSYSTTLATAQMIQSPYSDVKNAILVIASANKGDLKNALTYFGDTKELWKLYGDGFVADKDELFLYRFKEENAKEKNVPEEFFERTDVMSLIYVAGAILIILLVAVIFMIKRYRRGHDHEENE